MIKEHIAKMLRARRIDILVTCDKINRGGKLQHESHRSAQRYNRVDERYDRKAIFIFILFSKKRERTSKRGKATQSLVYSLAFKSQTMVLKRVSSFL